MKKFIFGLFVGVVLATATSVYADDGLEKVEAFLRPNLPIILNGQEVKLGSPSVMVDGNIYLKLRDIVTMTGMQIGWDEATQTVELRTTSLPSSSSSTPKQEETGVQITEKVPTLEELKGTLRVAERNLLGYKSGLNMILGSKPDSPILQTNAKAEHEAKIVELEKQIADLKGQIAEREAQSTK